MGVVDTYSKAEIAVRLRRIADIMEADATKIYQVFGVKFEQRWSGVLALLDMEEPTSVTELADKLGITHVSVSQTCASLERAKLIKRKKDPNDARRKILSLSKAGEQFVADIRPLWYAFEDAGLALNAELHDIAARLDRLQSTLEDKGYYDRVLEAYVKARRDP